MTPHQQKLVAAIRAATASGWAKVPGRGISVRWDGPEEPTPESIPARWWGETTYRRTLFVEVVVGRSWTCFLTVSNNPWTDQRVTQIPMRRAVEVLGDPGAAWRT